MIEQQPPISGAVPFPHLWADDRSWVWAGRPDRGSPRFLYERPDAPSPGTMFAERRPPERRPTERGPLSEGPLIEGPLNEGPLNEGRVPPMAALDPAAAEVEGRS